MRLPVFYSPEMVAQPVSFSPSAGKPRAVVEDWLRRCLPIELRAPRPVTALELERVHDPSFVRDVLELRAENGFGDRSPEVAASLAWTSGAMLSAARCAYETNSVACAPCSGFHHAGFARSSGFCTFNGLMVTAAALLEDGLRHIGIVDCDMHYGDGTDELIEKHGLDDGVSHFTAGASYAQPSQAAAFLDRLPGVVRSMKDCDVILYQAGADPHVSDPLGGFLDDEQLRARDEIVFRTARALGVPVAWNLAGGYQRDADGGISAVLSVHAATARAAISAWTEEI